MVKLKVLIACEESQEVCKAFRELGHEAYSCDILPCSGGHPEWHIQEDALRAMKEERWDLLIAHPPCTFLSRAGTRWLYPKGRLDKTRFEKGLEAKKFFLEFWLNLDIPMVVVENPVPHKVFKMPEETQRIQPYEFGHPLKKTTLLWIRGLPKLIPTNYIARRINYIDKKGIKHTGLNGWSAKRKSKTFSGIAKAMATQWSEYLTKLNDGNDGIPPKPKVLGILPTII